MVQQYQDINNKTGIRNLKGTSGNTYGNMSLLNASEISAALADGITTWSPPTPTLSDEALRNKRYRENQIQADIHILNAELNPVVGTVYDLEVPAEAKTKEREDRKRSERARCKNGITDADDTLASYIGSVRDAQDSADDSVEGMDRAALDSYDASAWTYPTWTPPTP